MLTHSVIDNNKTIDDMLNTFDDIIHSDIYFTSFHKTEKETINKLIEINTQVLSSL
jgi:hypothetical protein